MKTAAALLQREGKASSRPERSDRPLSATQTSPSAALCNWLTCLTLGLAVVSQTSCAANTLITEGSQLVRVQSAGNQLVSPGAQSCRKRQPPPPASGRNMDALCSAEFYLGRSERMASYTDGRRIFVTRGLVDAIEREGQPEWVSVVLAHELSHVLLGHRQQLAMASRGNGPLAAITRPRARIRATEIEADRLSVWLLVAADISPQQAVAFWQWYGPRYGHIGGEGQTHPPYLERIQEISAQIDCINTSGAAGNTTSGSGCG